MGKQSITILSFQRLDDINLFVFLAVFKQFFYYKIFQYFFKYLNLLKIFFNQLKILLLFALKPLQKQQSWFKNKFVIKLLWLKKIIVTY